ncbi:hypothetical protein B7463_g5394, partial [Scytalidium lignicola]
MAVKHDFIIVGADPAGSTTAYELAKSASKPSVLLIEAGGWNNDANWRIATGRFEAMKNTATNWGYKSVPQEQLNNREIDFSREEVVGGSTEINFGFWTVGSKDDYNDWADILADDSFNWENTQRRLKKMTWN